MSLAPQMPLVPIAVYSSVMDTSAENIENKYPVLKGATTVNITKFSPSGGDGPYGNGKEINFNVFSPAKANTITSKNMIIEATMTVKFTRTLGTNETSYFSVTSTTPDADNPDITNRVSPQPFPFQNSINTLTYIFDGKSQSYSMESWYKHLRYRWFGNEDSAKLWNSSTPALLDNNAFFNSGDVGNVLGWAKNSTLDGLCPRGARLVKVETTGFVAGASSTATFTYKIWEPLPALPLSISQDLQGQAGDLGFLGYSNFMLKINLNSGLFTKCMNINALNEASIYPDLNVGVANVFATKTYFQRDASLAKCLTSASHDVSFSDVKLVMSFMTMSPLQQIPPVIPYDWKQINDFTETYTTAIPASTPAGPGKSSTISLRNYQLPAVPNIVTIFAVPSSIGALSDWEYGSIMLPIYNISITFANTPGILASADANTLYQYSIKNGVRGISFENSGMGGNFLVRGYDKTAKSFSLGYPLGMPLVLSMGDQIVSQQAAIGPGLGLNTNFQANINLYNYLPQTVTANIVVVFEYDGTMTISQSSGVDYGYGFLTQENIIEADSNEILNTRDVGNVLRGGSLWGDVKKFGRKTWGVVKSPEFRKALNFASDLNIPVVSDVADMASSGINKLQRKGNAYIAGQLLSNRDIRGGAQDMSLNSLKKRMVN